jgi:hypothetical protein
LIEGFTAMASVTIGFGVLLILLGLGGYFGTRRVSVTALIPAFIGLPILVLGLLAQTETAARGFTWGAAIVAVIGFLGAARGLPQLVRMLAGRPVARPIAAVMQSVMAILCAVYAITVIGWLVTTP